MSPQALFFGTPPVRAYGVFHGVESSARPDLCALLCPATFDEYLRSHHVFGMLQRVLAERGIPSLRFDYQGTGDSDGRLEDVALEDWIASIHGAEDVARELSGCARVCKVGLRLGATLAWLSTGEARPPADLVLWRPVVSGKAFLTEIRTRMDQWIAGSFTTRRWLGNPWAKEVGPYRISRALFRSIARIELSERRASAARALVLGVGADQALCQHVAAARTGYIESEPQPEFWLKAEDNFGKTFQPRGDMARLASWIEDAAAA